MLAPGTEPMLFREPENEQDEWAIAVYLTEKDKIGYLSRYKNETIARLMDVGKKFVAVVEEKEVGSEIMEEDVKEENRRKKHRQKIWSCHFLFIS